MIRKRLPFPIDKENMHCDPKLAGAILKLGLPVALLLMCTEISYLVILGFVNVFGEIASLGVGMASAASIGGIMAYLSFFHGDTMSLLFTSDPQVIAASATFLKATAFAAIFMLVFCCVEYLVRKRKMVGDA